MYCIKCNEWINFERNIKNYFKIRKESIIKKTNFKILSKYIMLGKKRQETTLGDYEQSKRRYVGDMEREFKENPSEEVAMVNVGQDTFQSPSVEELNRYINDIITGQVDVTVDPELAVTEARTTLVTLYEQLQQIIAEKEAVAKRIIAEREQTSAVAMAEQEQETLIQENIRMINNINNAMIRAQDGRLNRQQRLELNTRIMRLISSTVTEAEIQRELERDSTARNIRGLYDALIQYYTEMTSYGYQRSPKVLANIGAILGGTAMLGSAVFSGSSAASPAGVLMMLSNYLGIAASVASGLYLLQRGGLNVQGFLQQTGAVTRQCIERGCKNIAEYGKQGLTSFINVASERLNKLLEEDPDSDISTQDSESSSYSTASSAGTEIRQILDVPDNQQRNEVLGVVPPDENLTQLNFGTQSTTYNSDTKDDFNDVGFDTAHTLNSSSTIDGGRKRKSRCHTKSKKTKKGRKGRKHRMTKKGRKHHKTMKRHRTKMRR